jgi:hypothetical protein
MCAALTEEIAKWRDEHLSRCKHHTSTPRATSDASANEDPDVSESEADEFDDEYLPSDTDEGSYLYALTDDSQQDLLAKEDNHPRFEALQHVLSSQPGHQWKRSAVGPI